MSRPRPVRALLASLLVACVALLVGVGTASAAEADVSPPATEPMPLGRLGEGGRVLVVAVPRLTWSMVDPDRTPTLAAFADAGAVASMSVRTIGPITTVGEGYLTIGAGNRATALAPDDGLALAPDAPYAGARAGEVYRRRTGLDPGDAAAVQLTTGAIVRRNDHLLYGAEPGALGTALRAAGLSGAVVANDDVVQADGRVLLQRQAALAVMDGAGLVAGGEVEDLTVDDATAPGGRRLDADAVVAATTAALDAHDVVLVELSDLDRADLDRSVMTGHGAALARDRALADTDAALAQLLGLVDPARDLVVVVAPAAPRAQEQLTVLALQGPGVGHGQVRSATTRRDGYVTLPDLAPTILHAVGVALPDEMTGTRMSVTTGRATPASMARDNEVALFRDEAVGPVSVTYIVAQVLVYAAAAVALTRGHRRLRPGVAVAALGVLAVPLVAFASGAVAVDGLGVGGYTAALMLVSLVAGLAVWPLRRVHLLLPPLILVGGGLLLQWVDVLTGGRLQLDTPFGYSPIVAGRFAGFGNLAFALITMEAIVTATALWGIIATDPGRRRLALVLCGGVMLITLALDGAPFAGSDVGGVLSSLPAYAVTLAVLAGWRINLRRAVLVGLATVAVVTSFALVDLARPEEDRTHLGRFAASVFNGDATLILRRKAEANVSILTSSVWTWVIPVALAFLAFLATRRTGFLQRLFLRVEGSKACVVGGLTAGVLGFALNDSGVAIPAMMFGTLLPHLAYLVVRTSDGRAPRPGPVPAVPAAAADATTVSAVGAATAP